ncbi:hypothetical protein TL16_g10417 [Triparma laevis f. inornata]|uniref:Uncharacterized protein n=1 Tax=Triparma laevis f. inornata TaxID=1714386 RepID=A0A9W7BDN2_9STRA|nr:hypothetical protein TL16_g10417 [Triparma laevis f. inornata]
MIIKVGKVGKVWIGLDRVSEKEDLFGRWRGAKILEYFCEVAEVFREKEERNWGSTYVKYEEGERDVWYEAYLEDGDRVKDEITYKEDFGVY